MVSRCRAVVRHESAIHSRHVRCIYAAGSYPSAIREISHEDIRARRCRRRTFSPWLVICLPRDPIPSVTSTPASTGRKEEPRYNKMRKQKMKTQKLNAIVISREENARVRIVYLNLCVNCDCMDHIYLLLFPITLYLSILCPLLT